MFGATAYSLERWSTRRAMRAPVRSTATPTETEILALLCPDWHEAMFVLDADTLTVAYANIRALDMFNRRQPLALIGGRLDLSSASGAQRLKTMVKHTVANDISRAAIVIDDDLHHATYGLRIFLPQGFMREILQRALAGGAQLVVVEVARGDTALSDEDLDALAAAFDLTAAETSIMTLLGEGRSLGEIAAIRGVELETVRNQTKKLMAKTRTRRQSDLVKLIMSLCGRNSGAPMELQRAG